MSLVSFSEASTSVTLLGGVAVGVLLLLDLLSDLEGALLLGLLHDLLSLCLRSVGLLDLDLLDLLLGSLKGLQDNGSLYTLKDRWVLVIARVTRVYISSFTRLFTSNISLRQHWIQSAWLHPPCPADITPGGENIKQNCNKKDQYD